ncbi:hypothetical protein [Kordiimonas sp. SCSIO 12610]|uniref:hypothetical protein n=1 Tax=Kordiimonas sp. SCSIO 12610 TaxID=2829597 RepID=UPI002108A1C2|nr:hypothetical protein [Kordiimonas sp. SCSIO 12610]UTW56546.1 hypothetical protein KFF44_06505 [Kordiimonas sp. SCSIO 12610]
MTKKSLQKEPENNTSAILMGVAILLVILVFAIDTPEKCGTLKLKVVGISKQQSDTATPTLLVAELDTGRRVTLGKSSTALRKKGEFVIADKYCTQILKRVSYRYVSHVNQLAQ